MNLKTFYLLGFSTLVFFDTTSQISFKLVTMRSGEFSMSMDWGAVILSSYWTYIALLGYLGSFVTWITLLKHAPVGFSFAASHAEIITVLIISVWFFHEHLTWLQVSGALCILLGIALLGLSEAKHMQRPGKVSSPH